MDAKDFLTAFANMCSSSAECKGCPLDRYKCCDLLVTDNADLYIRIVKEWEEQKKRKAAVLIPDEMTNVFTFQATYIDKAGYEYTEAQKRDRRRFMEELLRGALPNADDFRCTDFQQFATKAHEQSEEEREDAEKWHE